MDPAGYIELLPGDLDGIGGLEAAPGKGDLPTMPRSLSEAPIRTPRSVPVSTGEQLSPLTTQEIVLLEDMILMARRGLLTEKNLTGENGRELRKLLADEAYKHRKRDYDLVNPQAQKAVRDALALLRDGISYKSGLITRLQPMNQDDAMEQFTSRVTDDRRYRSKLEEFLKSESGMYYLAHLIVDRITGVSEYPATSSSIIRTLMQDLNERYPAGDIESKDKLAAIRWRLSEEAAKRLESDLGTPEPPNPVGNNLIQERLKDVYHESNLEITPDEMEFFLSEPPTWLGKGFFGEELPIYRQVFDGSVSNEELWQQIMDLQKKNRNAEFNLLDQLRLQNRAHSWSNFLIWGGAVLFQGVPIVHLRRFLKHKFLLSSRIKDLSKRTLNSKFFRLSDKNLRKGWA